MASPFAPLRRGEFEFLLRNRALVVPERVVGGLTIQPTLGARWRMTEGIRLTIDAQTVDNSGPGRQGTYLASRVVPGGGSGNFLQEIAVEASAAFLPNDAGVPHLIASASLSRGVRSYFAHDDAAGKSFGGNRRRLIPTIELGGYQSGRWGSVTGAVGTVVLPDDDALYLRAIPGETRRFGVVVGPRISANLNLAEAFSVWGRAFAPLTGNNSINRSSGRPARAMSYDAGVRLGLNPALDFELFASNALGNTGALSFIPDREYQSIGAGLAMRPGTRFELSRASRADPVRDLEYAYAERPATVLGARTLPVRSALLRVRNSTEAFSAAVEYSLVDHLSFGAFLDYPRATIDEGELGALVRLTLVDERDRAPVTVGMVVAASRTNNPLINFLTGRRDELQRRGLGRGGFRFGDENSDEGRLYVIALALPIERRIDGGCRRDSVPSSGWYSAKAFRCKAAWPAPRIEYLRPGWWMATWAS
ncbi:MAG: hypothetical protein ABI877_05020 [Gemmatimonadaceae bacterium]